MLITQLARLSAKCVAIFEKKREALFLSRRPTLIEVPAVSVVLTSTYGAQIALFAASTDLPNVARTEKL